MWSSIASFAGSIFSALVGWVPMVFAWLAAKRKVERDSLEKSADHAKRAAEIDETTDDLRPNDRAHWLHKGRPPR